MILKKKEHVVDNCDYCLKYGMMQNYVIKVNKNCQEFHNLLCRDCIRELIRKICQWEIKNERMSVAKEKV